MIKLIVTDLDGTLLTPENKVPDGFLAFAEKLLDHGIRIAAVSGREGFHVAPHFPGLEDRILIAANNGGVFFDGKKIFARNPMPMETIHKLCDALLGIPKISIVLSGEKQSYLWRKTVTQDLMDYFGKEIPPERLKRIFPVYDDPFQVIADNHDFIGKVALFHPENAEKAYSELLLPFISECHICPSELNWVNIMKKGVQKGLAVQCLQKYLGVTPDETMAFGDYLNDLDMFKHVKYSYAMANGRPELKAIAHAIAPSNREGGVLQVLRSVFSDLDT